MENIIKRGTLEVLECHNDVKENFWEKKYFVLYGKDKAQLPRLDWFTDEKTYKEKPFCRKTIYLQDILSVQWGGSRCNRAFTFEIVKGSDNQKERVYYSGGSKAEVDSWVSAMAIDKTRPPLKPPRVVDNISEGIKDDTSMILPPTQMNLPGEGDSNSVTKYNVEVQETDGSKKCGVRTDKKHILQMTDKNMVLLEVIETEQKHILTWPYKYIRRYGRSTHSFTFEAGRKCESGEGLFTFSVQDGETVFEEVHRRTKAMKHNKSLTMDPGYPVNRSLPPTPPTPTSPMQPAVPERKYSEDTVKELKSDQHNRNGIDKTLDKEKTHMKKSHGVKAIKETFKNIGDHLSDSLHLHDRRSKGSFEDVHKKSSGSLTVEDNEVMGTIGKYSSSPNMKQRCLPPVPTYTNTSPNQTNSLPVKQPPLRNDHKYQETNDNENGDAFYSPPAGQYALYDDTYKTGPGGDLYEEKPQLDSGLHDLSPSCFNGANVIRSMSVKSTGNESGFDEEEQDHYSSIDEEDRKNFQKQLKAQNADFGGFKMSGILSQAKKMNQSNTTYDDVDGGPLPNHYDYTYAGEYDSIDFLKDQKHNNNKTGNTFDSAAAEESTYGMLSLGFAKKDEVSYVNTSKMPKASGS